MLASASVGQRRCLLGVLILASAFSACDNPTEVRIDDVASIALDAENLRISEGATHQFRATLRDSDGKIIKVPVTWASSDDKVASVSDTGLLEALLPGSVEITASAAEVSARASVTVEAQLDSIVLSPGGLTVTVGTAFPMEAVLLDVRGDTVSRNVIWSSSDTTVVRVDKMGLVTAIAKGTAVVRAVHPPMQAEATITVVGEPTALRLSDASLTIDQGQTVQLTAEVLDEDSAPIDVAVLWASTNGLVATVSPAGYVTGHAPGTSTITASAGFLSATASVEVRRVLASVVISPSSHSLVIGDSTHLSAAVYDVLGEEHDLPVTWSSERPSVATVDPYGVVQSVSVGTSVITASAEGISGSAQIEITPRPDLIIPSVNHLEIPVGATDTLFATIYDHAGDEMSGTITWVSNDPSVVTVTSAGVVKAQETGTAVIEARHAGLIASVMIDVTPVAGSITLNPTSLVMQEGTESPIAVTVRDTRGNIMSGVSVKWTSSDSEIAHVNGSGVVVAGITGTATLTASYGSVSRSIDVYVEPFPAELVPDPSSITLLAGETGRIRVNAYDFNNDPVSVQYNWRTDDPGIATVDQHGYVSAINLGRTDVIVSGGGLSKRVPVYVNEQVAKLEVTPTQVTMTDSESTQAAAVARDRRDHIIDVPITWRSTNDAVVTVSPTGRLQGVAPGVAYVIATAENTQVEIFVTINPTPPDPDA